MPGADFSGALHNKNLLLQDARTLKVQYPRIQRGCFVIRKGAGLTIDQGEFRRVLGHFASGVTVVTTCYEQTNYGITVSSFSSLSLVPPLVLICIDQKVSSHAALQNAGVFAVNILPEEGERLSRHFATREVDKFKGVAFHTGQLGAPLLDEALGTIECRIVQQVPGGDHTIFIGEVTAAATRPGKPLIYYRSGYHQID